MLSAAKDEAIGAAQDQVAGAIGEDNPLAGELASSAIGAAGDKVDLGAMGSGLASAAGSKVGASAVDGMNNFMQPGKKASTILSPHLEALTTGSLLISLDNSSTSHPIG